MKFKRTNPYSYDINQFIAPKHFLIMSLFLSVLACGCQPLMNKKSMIPWGSKKEETKVIPDRILAVWTDTVLHQQGQTGVRGFGGRVYFYEKDKTDPIEVEGSLAVYAFDAEDDAIDSQKPLRKFVFTPEQLASRMSKTSIGPSYSIWLPWSSVGDPPQKLSLITRFEGVDGGTTISDPVIKLLPGIAKKVASDKKPNAALVDRASSLKPGDLSVQPASYSESKESEYPERIEKRSVETIELPPGFQRHLNNSEYPQKRSDQNGKPVVDLQPETSTQVFDARNPKPRSENPIPIGNDNTGAVDEKSRFFSSSRPDRSNIRNGSWLKPDRRLQDGIDRGPRQESLGDRGDTAP
jgi:hypothetical protein